MGRVKANVSVDGQNYWALFDGGAINTYVVEDLASRLPTFELERPEPVALGGKTHNVTRKCRLSCLVEGLLIDVLARVVKEIGKDEKGKRIEVLIGALAMEEWGIVPIPKEKRLDMTHYPKEFVEY
ncbi:MAG: hypothetical protein ACE5OR_05935 [bacterium]